MQLNTNYIRSFLILTITVFLCIELVAKARNKKAENEDNRFFTAFNSEISKPALQDATDEKFEFKAYPNPFKSSVYVDIYPGEEQLTQFKMYDLIGKEILSFDLSAQDGTQNYTLNLSDIKPGIYIASIESEDGVVETRKFVKLS